MRITDDDKALFRASVAGLRRLQPVKAPPRPAPPPPTAAQTRADHKAVLREMAEAAGASERDDGEAYRRPGVSPRVCRELRAGRYVIRSELDLHGVRSFELAERLNAFLCEARLGAERCVRIVHGKGRNSPGKEPVLKELVRRMLRRRAEVLAYCTAPAHDGGSGALYVLLAR